jgi:C1A family cysteine protease
MIYYLERVLEGSVKSDSGAYIRDGFKVMANTGACKESTWPYTIAKFKSKPPKKAYLEAANHQLLTYLAVNQSVDQLKACLSDGFPFVFGFSVYTSFETATVAKTGVVPMPTTNETLLGGHAVLACGYDDATQRFLVRNSWGTGWGQAGYFTIPYAYLADPNLASDFWTGRSVEG